MNRAARLARHRVVSSRLAQLSDGQLAALLDQAVAGRASIGGTTVALELDGVTIFVKSVPLTDLERRPEHAKSTANLFQLPTFYQYGVGSAGFGAWRELAVHTMTTSWVLGNECQSFPILYHWRVLPGPPPRPSTSTEPQELEQSVAYWDGSPAVRSRLTALARCSASLVLLMEHIPQTVHHWLGARVAAGGQEAASACALVEQQLAAGVAFMSSRDLMHFDAHFDNLLTDGEDLFIADFGLALCSDFDLSSEEAEFFRQHLGYDRCYTTTHLTRWLLTALYGATPADRDELLRRIADGRPCAELPAYAAEIVSRHARVAVVMSDFLRSLQTTSKRTPYPAALSQLGETGASIE